MGEMSGVFVVWISVDGGCDEWRLDVCPDDDDGIWSDVVAVEVTVEVSLVEDDGLRLMEELGLVELLVLEGDQWFALGSSRQGIA